MRNWTNIFLALILILAFLIRVWNLNLVPSSLYWDEMDAGYQAYSILKTGKDYFGNIPGLVVHSFADYRAPVFIYSLMPLIAILGLNAFSVRTPAAIFGVLNVFLVYLLGRTLFKSKKIGLIAALLTAFSPWNIQYSRMAFETTLMLSLFMGGVISFYKGLKNSKWHLLSGALLGMAILTYNTAKLFVPLIFLFLVLTFIRRPNLDKNFWLGSSIFGLVLALSFYSTIFLGAGQRFSEISVLTDPQISTEIDFLRTKSALSYTQNREVGTNVRFIDKLVYNKATFIIGRITQNYLIAFSTQFIFISGDPNLRHSPERIGELYRIEFITVLFGLGFLLLNLKAKDKGSLFLLSWIIFAPIPAVITREGGLHATRLAFLFPALGLVSALGVTFIWQLLPKKVNLVVLGALSLVWVFGVTFFINYYFGAYKQESAKFFQYGFSQAVQETIKQTGKYDYVIIDDRKDSALMNYLFETKYNPLSFQSEIGKMAFETSVLKGDRLQNIVFAKPGRRDWAKIFAENLISGNYALVVSSEQLEEQTAEKVPNKLTKNQKLLNVIYYQDGGPAFYVIESKIGKASYD